MFTSAFRVVQMLTVNIVHNEKSCVFVLRLCIKILFPSTQAEPIALVLSIELNFFKQELRSGASESITTRAGVNSLRHVIAIPLLQIALISASSSSSFFSKRNRFPCLLVVVQVMNLTINDMLTIVVTSWHRKHICIHEGNVAKCIPWCWECSRYWWDSNSFFIMRCYTNSWYDYWFSMNTTKEIFKKMLLHVHCFVFRN